MQVLAIVGSLRKDSINRKAAQAFGEVLPSGSSLEFGEISEFPLFNSDITKNPEPVLKLADQIRNADAVLFASPEYNYSISGALKNAIDWLSRLDPQPLAGKTAAIIGASPGNVGTARAQYHLRQIGVFLDIRFINKPETMVGQAFQKFDESGKLIDEKTREHFQKLAEALQAATTGS